MSGVSINPIAELNDQLRTTLGIPALGCRVPGQIIMTKGIASLSESQISTVLNKVREFEGFSEDNDPYGEHDFGSLDFPTIGKVFWKIDYYADAGCRFGSEDPSNPKKSYRVLTIMLASEY